MTEFKQYTIADVSTRNGRGTAPVWIIYKDSIYDLTNFLNEHPGGTDTIVEYAGRDATSAFDDVGHTGDAKHMISKYKVGEIVEEERRYDVNGKKKKRVVPVLPADKPQGRSCFNIITCGLVG